MDGRAAIEHNAGALRRILAMLVAMAGLPEGEPRHPHPEARAEGERQHPHPEARAEGEPRRTLPRRLRNAILRLLRPAEAATRRLIIALASGLAVTVPAPRPRKPIRPPLNIDIDPYTGVPRRLAVTASTPLPAAPGLAALPRLSLLDPPRHQRRHSRVPASGVPRILLDGVIEPALLRPPPSPGDRIDSTRLHVRLGALGRALDDLSGHARRFARWQARQALARRNLGAAAGTGPARLAAGKLAFRAPLRWGRPPGLPRRGRHEVHDILAHAHRLASFALTQPDTS